MNKIIIIFTLLLSSTLFAKTKHREHEAHVHGAGSLGIAFDDTKGKLDFKIPSESIFGFEYTPKKEKDIQAMNEGLEKLVKNISEMVVFEPTLKCLFTKEKIEVVKEKNDSKDHQGGHSETQAAFSVQCEKSPLGSQIVFNFQKFFPRIKDLDVQILAGSLQKSVEAKRNGTRIELK